MEYLRHYPWQKKPIQIQYCYISLPNDIKKSDTIEMAVKRIVKMALAAEFGAELLTSSKAKGMIDTITYGILHDNELRKQALLIIDRFAK